MDFYFNPAKYGMRQIGAIDWSDGNYQFDLTVVWIDRDVRFWYGDDAGCSCPTPFEDTNVTDLVELTSLEQFKAHCESRARSSEDRSMELVVLEKLHAEGLR